MTTRKLTTDEFKKIVFDLEGEKYLVLGDYVNSKIEITMKHNEDGCNHIFDIKPTKFVHRNQRCPKCFKNNILYKENFLNKVYEKYGNEYIVLGDYKGYSTKIKFMHNIIECGKIFYKTPDKFFYRNQVCSCASKNKKKILVTDNFKKRLLSEVGSEYILVGEYFDANSEVTIKHNINDCNREFDIVARLLFRNEQRCPYCNSKISKGEKRILQFLQENKMNFKTQYQFEDCKNIYELKFDFVIFDKNNELNYLIEYDGKQHYMPIDFAGKGEEWAEDQFIETKKRDQIKNDYCKNKNIPLLRIPYWEYENIEEILNNLIF